MVDVEGTVFVVDDDKAVRLALTRLLSAVGWQVEAFASAEQFLLSSRPRVPACLVLDLRLPGCTGLELQKALGESAANIPIVFLTGHGDIPIAVSAMRAGATHFLLKPFTEDELLGAVEEALALSSQRQERDGEVAEVRDRVASLTPRQLQVMRLVARGMLNKQIATTLGIAEKTVKVHRSHMMQAMQVSSVAELVRALSRAEPDGARTAARAG
ncbi:response regulator [bacterium]|nr:response regulator [bacterium]